MKRIKPNYLMLIMLALCAQLVSAYDIEINGIYYNVPNGVGSASVTYKTDSYNSYSGNVTIPEFITYNGRSYPVTHIVDHAFQDCNNLTSITIPNSMRIIQDYAFYGCTSLTSVSIPNNVLSVGAYTFMGCTNLASVTFGSSVETIGYQAFANCVNLTSISFPNSVSQIAIRAFENCSSLADINIPNSVTYIGYNAFFGTAWFDNQPDGLIYAGSVAYKYKGNMPLGTTITIKDGTTSIAGDAFWAMGTGNCNGLISITIPNSVSEIGASAFRECIGLTSISIPNSVTRIDTQAFCDCSNLSSIFIPSSVTVIGTSVFSGCDKLTRITVDSDNHTFDSRDNCNAIIRTASNMLTEGCSNTVIPNTVTSIGERAFDNRKNLFYIDIPNSVYTINRGAFYGCGLTNINLPNSLTTIGEIAFWGTSLSSITIPNSVKKIGYGAFYSNNSFDVTLCGNIETVGTDYYSIFRGVNNLYIKSSVTSLPNFGISPNTIYCYSRIPPTCSEGTFSSYTSGLHVQPTSIAAYFTANYWCNFANIYGDAIEPDTICLNHTVLELLLEDQASLTVNILPNNANPKSVNWVSTNPTIATVSNGIVTTLALGECDVIASILDKQAICHVIVRDPSKIISLDQSEAQVLPNHIITITPSTSPNVLSDLTVTSSDPTVAAARVMNGKVQVVGIKEGITTITVGSTDGTAIPATCLVTVYTECGDVNMDGFVTISDVTQIIDYLLSGDASNIKLENADVNSDGKYNISDVTALIDRLLSGN